MCIRDSDNILCLISAWLVETLFWYIEHAFSFLHIVLVEDISFPSFSSASFSVPHFNRRSSTLPNKRAAYSLYLPVFEVFAALRKKYIISVSYTHLTLPTSDLV